MDNVLLYVAGALLQLIFRYFPKVSDWYQSQQDKGPIMLGFVVLVALAYFGVACWPFAADILKVTLACSAAGAKELIGAVIAIAVGNQLTYLFTKKVG